MSDWKDAIIRQLEALYTPEDLARIVWYLSEEEKEYKNCEELSPVWRHLKSFQGSPAFKPLADRILVDTKRAERDGPFRSIMNIIYNLMMTHSDAPVAEGQHQGWDLVKILDDQELKKYSFALGLARNWSLISVAAQRRIVDLLPALFTGQNALMSADELASALMGPRAGSIVMVTLSAVYLTWEAYTSIRMWMRGEITGVRCVKNIIDSAVSIAAGAAGGVGGSALGAMVAGPFGAIIGGIVGGIFSAHLAKLLSDRLTQSFFGLPKSAAVENAYAHLGVHMTASNGEVNTAFRQLCLLHHPDKGGNREEFEVLQNAMAIIREVRENM